MMTEIQELDGVQKKISSLGGPIFKNKNEGCLLDFIIMRLFKQTLSI